MKMFIKIIYGLFAFVITAAFIYIIYDTFLTPKYYNKIASGNVLESDVTNYLKETFNFKKDEEIILLYGNGAKIKDGGSFITNYRVITFLEGENSKNAEQELYENIEKVTLDNDKDSFKNGIIIVKRKNSTEFSIQISNSEYYSKKFFDRINKFIKK